jgi:hypothetical protein
MADRRVMMAAGFGVRLGQFDGDPAQTKARTVLMIIAPMLADFAIRLAFGLAASLLLTSWKAVPLGFFRTQTYVVLGLLVLAGLDQARAGGLAWMLWALVAGAVFAYLAAVAWGLGLPRFGIGASVLVAMATAAWLGAASHSGSAQLWVHGALSRFSSGFLLGSTLTAMLLGHHYLTAPAMSIEPLKRIIGFMACALLARCVLAGFGVWATGPATIGLGASAQDTQTGMFLMARWGMGFVGVAIATFMTWKTAQIRSTQSATGILYIAMIFVLFGELTSMIMAGRAGVMY